MARPSDISREVEVERAGGKKEKMTVGDACVLARSLGAPLRDCATFAGISPATLFSWTAKGREYQPDYDEGQGLDDVDEQYRPYVEFMEQMEVADGRAVLVNLDLLRKRAEDGDTKAITWLLEKTRRRDFGPQIAVSGSIDIEAGRERAEKMSDDELDEQLVGGEPGDNKEEESA